ncbi:MAG: DUF1343 domain-containing protein [bacterium]
MRPGVDQLFTTHHNFIEGKRVGLITNATGIDHHFVSTIDRLAQDKTTKLTALFGPEHGVRGDHYAGAQITDYVDERTSVPVYSLYGTTRRPNAEMLKNVDVLVYDIQDIGARSYTYISTMASAMVSAKEFGKKFVVLDRPNPLGGNLVDGNVLTPGYESFVGIYPIPYVYGMTPGECALYFNQEFGIGCDLTVVPMKNWTRDMVFMDTGLPWVPSSTHIPHPETAFFYSITGMVGELQLYNEGVGYTLPFEVQGAPWVDAYKLADVLNAKNLPGVHFMPILYSTRYHTYSDPSELCRGVQIYITDYRKVRPFTVGVEVMHTLNQMYPEKNLFNPTEPKYKGRLDMFDKVMGSKMFRDMMLGGKTVGDYEAAGKNEMADYMAKRAKILLYD